MRLDIENVDTWEHRPDRPYDEQGAAGREVLALHDQAREAS